MLVVLLYLYILKISVSNYLKTLQTTFLTHEYPVGVAVSCSRDFVITIKFCATTANAKNLPASFGRPNRLNHF